METASLSLIGNRGGLTGPSADLLLEHNFDTGVLRPWRGRDGRSYVTLNQYNPRSGRVEPRNYVTNAPATLTRDAWIQFDNAIMRVIRSRLRAFADIRAAGNVYNLPNGMAHTMLQWQTMADVTGATISMDPIRRSEADQPLVDADNLPLPVVHKDFDFSARQISTSRLGQMPLDTTMAEMAARAVAEAIEMMTVGTAPTFSYGGGTIYGYINHPSRATKFDMPVPTGANGPAVIAAILTLRQMLMDDRHFGPYMLYFNSQWAEFLDNDFSATKGDQTLRQRILAIEGIQGIRTLDHLPNTKFHMLLVEMDPATVRAIIGMEVQTLQWESQGGLMKHFKVMALQVPQIRADASGNSGIAHGRTP